MKKIIAALLLLALTACAEISSEDVTAGVKQTYPDIQDIQSISLKDRDQQGYSSVKCDSNYTSWFMNTEFWAISRLKSQEVYLMKIARSPHQNTKTKNYDYTICYKQKLF